MKRMLTISEMYDKLKGMFADKTNTGVETMAGNLVVDGTITQNTYELDEDINPTMLDAAQGILTCYYSHARVSNGKLSIVFAFYMPYDATSQKTISSFTKLMSANIVLPADVLSKLYPSPITYLDIKSVPGQANGFGNFPALTLGLSKSANGIILSMAAPTSITQGSDVNSNAIWRFEFNFILS